MSINKERIGIYRKIVTSTAVLGSAQLLNMLMNMVRGRLVATILHSSGIGVMSLITNAQNTLQQIALMGINISAVRSVSQASDQTDHEMLDFTIRVVRTIVLIAAVAGLLLTIVMSPLMSEFSFGSSDYVVMFLMLSVSVMFSVLGAGETTIMQGLRRYKQLAFCSIIPPLCGLFLSIPLYYFGGIKAIVPAMILVNAIYFIFVRRYSYHADSKAGTSRTRLSLKTVWVQGHDIILFGIVMAVGSIVGTITTYSLSAFISNIGSVSDVGFYQSANVITLQYIGIVFTAMATDYYPHLSNLVKNSMRQAFRLVNQQTEIVMLTVAPLSLLIILTAPLIITILLGSDFMTIKTMVQFIGLSSVFKALCFPMDYIAYAKGDKQYIFWVETVWCNLKTFALMALFYYFVGLDGLGYGALLSAVVDVAVSAVLVRWRYGFAWTAATFRLIIVLVAMGLACLAFSFIGSALLSYLLMAAVTAVCFTFSFVQLDKRMDLRSVLSRWMKKFKRNTEDEGHATSES